MATKLHCSYCFDVLLDRFQGTTNARFEVKDDAKYPLFVTWKIHNGNHKYHLRGCIGTFSPQELPHGLKDYALTSALRDSRFDPIAVHEVEHLRCDVSLLTNFEVTNGLEDWKVGTHGVTIQFVCPVKNKRYSATFLPEVAMEQGWDHHKTIQELIYKSGYRGDIKSIRKNAVIQVTRYQSSKCSLTYAEYIQLRVAAGKYNQAVPALPSSHAKDHEQHEESEEESEEEEEEEEEEDD